MDRSSSPAVPAASPRRCDHPPEATSAPYSPKKAGNGAETPPAGGGSGSLTGRALDVSSDWAIPRIRRREGGERFAIPVCRMKCQVLVGDGNALPPPAAVLSLSAIPGQQACRIV